jgi:predicted enzyme related to lactoylglutathione lyase
MSRVIEFEVDAEDSERAIRFYESVFGWRFNKLCGTSDCCLIKTVDDDKPGMNGGLMIRLNPRTNTVNTIEVPPIEHFIDVVEENGGKVVTEKITIPGVGYLVYCQDTEGNAFGVFEAHEAA